MSKKIWLTILPLFFTLACGGLNLGGEADSAAVSDNSNTVQCAANAIEIDLIYAPESELYLNGETYDAINRFNTAYGEGRNPITGEALAEGEQPICVKGMPGSSGTIAQGIINAIIAPNNTNVARPTIYSPSVSPGWPWSTSRRVARFSIWPTARQRRWLRWSWPSGKAA